MKKIVTLILGICFLLCFDAEAQRRRSKYDAGKAGELASANSIRGRIELTREKRIQKRTQKHQVAVIKEGRKNANRALGGKLHKRPERKKKKESRIKEEALSKS
jgi:hypothetical protein